MDGEDEDVVDVNEQQQQQQQQQQPAVARKSNNNRYANGGNVDEDPVENDKNRAPRGKGLPPAAAATNGATTNNSNKKPQRREGSTWDDVTSDLEEVIPFNCGKLQKYEIGKPIGSGKFSVVYKAKDVESTKMVALKKIQIFDIMDAKSRKKCLREVKLLQSLSQHPNLIHYLDAFIEENELIIVFEWAELGDLRKMLRHLKQPLEEATVWSYFGQVCGAVAHMHEQRIMHRDIKPANIFLTANSVLKLGDLGLGRSLSDQSIEAFSKVGTPLYMSPEVLHGQGYDFKSDVWSLGCLLYELTMLKSPFEGQNQTLYDIFQKINACQYSPIPDTYSQELRSVVNQMIQTDPKRRPDCPFVFKVAQEQINKFKGQRSVHVMMHDIVDKLRFLDYLTLFCRPRSFPGISPTQFSAESPSACQSISSISQFRYFVEVCWWVLSLLPNRAKSHMDKNLRVEDDGASDSEKIAAAGALLKACAAQQIMGIESVAANRLKHGWGEAPCVLLSALLDVAVGSMVADKPKYDEETDAVVEEEGIDGGDGDGDDNNNNKNNNGYDEDEVEEDHATRKIEEDDNNNYSYEYENSKDVGLPAITLGNIWQWRERLFEADTAARDMGEGAPRAIPILEKLVQNLQEELQSITARETTINSQTAHMLQDRKQCGQQMEDVTSRHNKVQTIFGEKSQQVSVLQQSIDQLKQKIDEEQLRLNDREPLSRITKGISKLKEEIQEMDIRLQLARHRHHQIQHRQRNAYIDQLIEKEEGEAEHSKDFHYSSDDNE